VLAGCVLLLASCVYDPVYEGIRCGDDRDCPEGFSCIASGEQTACTRQQQEDGGEPNGDPDGTAEDADGDGRTDFADPSNPADPGEDASDSGPDASDPGGDPGPCQVPDRDADGYDSIECGGTDCNDDNREVHPQAQEGPPQSDSCSDGLDNDCDGWIDGQDAECGLDWWDLNFRRRRKIAFLNEARTENLDDFPVLVSLDGGPNGRIDYSQTQDQGQDLRFIDADHVTVLDHEIESWNEAGTSYVWVKVPRIDPASNEDFIWMYYGNPATPDGQNARRVWSHGYRAVYHLHDDFEDSTGSYPLSSVLTSDNEGKIASGQEFMGAGSFLDMGAELDILQNVTACTISVWAHPHYVGQNKDCLVFISRPRQNWADGYLSRALMCLQDYNEVEVGGRSRDNENYRAAATASLDLALQEWHFLVGVIDYAGDSISIYANGERQGTWPVNFLGDATANTPSPLSAIGSHANKTDYFFDGLMDEVRVADTTRSADWVAAQYQSMSNQFLIFHGEESLD
jgi:hypothetical protein